MFSIGEFSRIARVSPRQLRHYEALGLFQPERIDPETGYRFYSALQLPRLNRILALKDLGLTLPQIRRLLDANISAEEIRGMLTMRKAQVEQTLREELERIRSIEARIFQVEAQGSLTDDVVLKSVPSRNFLSLRQVLASKEQGFALMAQIFRFLPRLTRRGAPGQFALLFSGESFETENIDVEMGFMFDEEALEPVLLPDGRVMTVHPLPAVEHMATMIHIGITHHESCYGALGIWMEQNQYQLAGPGREVFIEPLQPDRLEEAVMEIQIPVTRTNRDHPALITE
jgi:DNA-binding transcriptional MerR regulator